MNDKYFKFRKKYKKFIYHDYKIEENNTNIDVTYDFEIIGLAKFYPKWSFRKTEFFESNKNNKKYMDLIDNLIFNLGMIELISYNKLTCSKTIVIECGILSKEQIEFYKKTYVNGLGEFFFVNNIVEEMNVDSFVQIEATGKKRNYVELEISLEGNLIPVGGGKDSALTLEVLKAETQINTPYSINVRKAVKDTIKTAGYEQDKLYAPIRTLDKNLIKLNNEGFLNGHTPFSAIIAFSSIIAALITGRKNIVLSNEASAEEVSVPGTNINHQYSKSLEFENDFREYLYNNIGKNIPNYFSLLRPLNEFQIVREFAKNPKYFNIFKSCNVASKADDWCLNCAKCLYVYIMLFATTDKRTISNIFEEDLLNNSKLYDIFMGLINPSLNKPFECVGTKEEINLSINTIIKKYEKEMSPFPYLIKRYIEETRFEYKEESDYQRAKDRLSKYWNENNNLNERFKELLTDYINK